MALTTKGLQGPRLETAPALSNAAAHVVVTALDKEAPAKAVKLPVDDGLLCETLLKMEGLALEASVESDNRIVVADVAKRHGHPDILVNHAGVILREPTMETAGDEFGRLPTVDLVSTDALANSIVPVMKRDGYARSINLSSIFPTSGPKGQTTDASGANDVIGLTKGMAAESGSMGITCNAVVAGHFLTETNRKIAKDHDFFPPAISGTPLRRLAEVAEPGRTMVKFASRASADLTGQILVMHGGMTGNLPGPSGLA